MLCKGDSLGVFQVESRAQINMLPRLRPREFYDLVIQVALVRPGPIQGDMVHPYLRRRAGLEEVSYPAPSPEHGPPDELYQVLNRTKGVPLFQEQAMKLAMVAAKFTEVEANGLRRAMATFRNVGTIGSFEALMVERMVGRGYDTAFAKRCFEQIKGFGSYGFPESHAASFAKLVYISSFIKCRHPAVFACALLNAQPMGFYAPAQIVRDAREHGVKVRGVDVNYSAWDNTLERCKNGTLALRIGLRQIDGLAEGDAQRLLGARTKPFGSLEELAVRARLFGRPLRLLADADAMRSLTLDRREGLWAVRRLPEAHPLPLFAAADARELVAELDADLPQMPLREHIAADYQTVRLSLKGHPMGILRDVFKAEGLLTCAETALRTDGLWTRTAGLVLVRQRPGKGNAIFITLEDETGVTNVVLWARLFERFRKEVMGGRLLGIDGRVQRSPEGVVHLMAQRVFDRTGELSRLSATHDTHITLSRADEFLNPQVARGRHPREVRVLPKSRDFH
jgi:error-prone DNA polymerase